MRTREKLLIYAFGAVSLILWIKFFWVMVIGAVVTIVLFHLTYTKLWKFHIR